MFKNAVDSLQTLSDTTQIHSFCGLEGAGLLCPVLVLLILGGLVGLAALATWIVQR